MLKDMKPVCAQRGSLLRSEKVSVGLGMMPL